MSMGESEEILRRLEEGQIDVGEALKRLDSPNDETAEPLPRPRLWRIWWAICFGSGIGLAVMAAGVATLGGWWWLAAVPAGLVALLLMLLGILSADAPWLQIHVETGAAVLAQGHSAGAAFAAAASSVDPEALPGKRAALGATALDELILTLEENLGGGAPLVIDVHEGRSGERVRLHIG